MSLKNLTSCLICAVSTFALASCSVQAQPAEQTPMVRVGQTHVSPVIDGKLGDAGWKNSIAIDDFAVTGTKTRAPENTEVRFVYDQQNLYVSWHVQESLLLVKNQQMYKVQTNAKKHDDDVLSDDSVELFLQPGKDAKVYEFDINSIGTLFDADTDKGDLWGSRNASWNSGAKVAAEQQDGYWTAEIAIPWKGFGMDKPPSIGSSWDIILARNAKARNEISAWNETSSAHIHSIKSYGNLVFDSQVPALKPLPLERFEAGKSTFRAQTSTSLNIDVSLTANGKTEHFTNGKLDSNKQVNVPLKTQAAKVLFQWNATEGQKYFYRSPQLLVEVESSLAHLSVTTSKSWTLYVNGDKVSSGDSAQNMDTAFPLAEGVNDIVVQAESGQATLQLTPPLFAPAEKITWRTHDVDQKILLQTDRQNWKLAANNKGTWGTAGKAAYLQHTLVYHTTRIFPVVSPAVYIAQNTAQHINFMANGAKGIRFNTWQMSLAVPPQFDVLGSSGFYGNVSKTNKPKFNMTKAGTVVIDGQTMDLYHVTATAPIIHDPKNLNAILTLFNVLFKFPTTVKLNTAKTWHFYLWAHGNQDAVSEAPQSIPVRVLPPLNGKQPKKFVWELWAIRATPPISDNESLLPDILDTARQAGFNKYQVVTRRQNNAQFNDEVRTYGMNPFTVIRFDDDFILDSIVPYLEKHPDERLLDTNGKHPFARMCTTEVLGKNWPMFAQLIEEHTKATHTSNILFDYETPVFHPNFACFDSRCLAQFRQFAKLGDDVKLDPSIIEQDYRDQWVNFMNYRTAELFKKIKTAVHAADPNVTFTVYSGYSNDITKSRYGVDWNMVGEMQAVDEAAMGYGRSEKMIKKSIEDLRGIPVLFGRMPFNDINSNRPSPPLLHATMLRRALDATGGVLIYYRMILDGRSWTAVADISRLTTGYENLFLHKTLESIKGQDPAEVQLVIGPKHTLLCVMNSSSTKASSFSFPVPNSLGTGKEYYGGQTIKGGQKLNLSLPPGTVRVFVF